MKATLALVSSHVILIVITFRVMVYTICTIEYYKYYNTIESDKNRLLNWNYQPYSIKL